MRLKENVNLWKHQISIINECVSRKCSFVYAGCATGKTLATLCIAERLSSKRVLVLSSKTSLHTVWEREIYAKFTDVDVLVLDKGNSKRKASDLHSAWGATPADRTLVIVVNYETAYLLPLEQYHFDLAIADESQALKSHDSTISLTLAKKCWNISYKIAATGTPFDDRLTDVYGQMRWLRPKIVKGRVISEDFGYWTHFYDDYVVYRTKGVVKIPIGYKNRDKLAATIAPYFSHISSDVLKLPPFKHQYIDVTLSKKHMAIYDDMRKKMIAQIEDETITAENVLVQSMRLQQIAAGHYTDHEGFVREIPEGDAKLRALLELIDSFGGQPFVVFTQFRQDIDTIQRALKAAHVSSLRLQGGRDEHQIWQKDNTQGLLVNIAAGSAGVDLTKSSIAVYYTQGYSRTDYTQSLARIRRPNRPNPVTYYHLRGLKTIDMYIDKALRGKGDMANDLLRDLTQL